MTSLTVLHAAMVLHIYGILFWAGTTVVDFISYQNFWKMYHNDIERARAAYQLLARFINLVVAGVIVILVSGIVMIIATKGVFASQVWFRIKMFFVIGALVNGIVVGKKAVIQIGALIADESLVVGSTSELIRKAKSKLRTFHVIQLLIFTTIFVLSVFKFN